MSTNRLGGAKTDEHTHPVWAWALELYWLLIIVCLVRVVFKRLRRRWRRHLPKVIGSDRSKRHWARWAAERWGRDAQNLGLVMVDETTRQRRLLLSLLSRRALPPTPPKLFYPSAQFEASRTGLRCRLWTIPGIGLDEVTDQAQHLANIWGCVRVDVAQERPGVLELRGHLYDPLAQPLSVVPDGRPLADWELHLGMDEDGDAVFLPLANLSGITVAGVPGTGKTSLQRWWLCQLAGHRAVQIAVLDGKVSDPLDGDYGVLASRCFAACGDDLGQGNELLGELYQLMRARSGWLRANRGTAQFWDHGPSRDCPLVLVVVDESHTYVTGATRKDTEACDSNVWHLTKLAKEGRSRGFLTVFITQKQTADAIPTAIRDVCQVGLSFGVRTMEGAVAALGDDIREYPDIAPTKLIGRQWTGVAVMRFPDRPGYHRVRTPYVSEADAARIAERYAGLCQTPRSLHVVEREEVPA